MNEDIQRAIAEAVEYISTPAPEAPQLNAMSVGDFVEMDLPPRQNVLAPIIPTQGLVMVYAGRGIGKTYFALGIAYAIAAGSSFLSWGTPQKRRVLYVDGEMPAVVMQERIRQTAKGSYAVNLPRDGLHIICADLHRDISADISTKAGQAEITRHLDGIDFLVLDNLSCLMSAGGENDSDAWIPIQEWLLSLRRRNITVMFVHHAGKGGQQRGCSKREDPLDTVIALKRPSDYTPSQGARFEVHFDKARGICGNDVTPIEASLSITDGAARWTWKPLEDVERTKVIGMLRNGLTLREVAEETGISKSKVGYIKKEAEASGELYDPDGGG